MTVRMRHTSSHTRNRRSHHALKNRAIVVEADSNTLRLPHRINEITGMYRGKQIVSREQLQQEEAKAEKKARNKREHVHEREVGVNEPVSTKAVEIENQKELAKSQQAEAGNPTDESPNARAGA